MTTAVIQLPTAPAFITGEPSLKSFGADLTSSLGGPTQRLLRLGSRFSIDVAYPPMAYSDAQTFLTALIQSEAAALAVPFPQRGLTIGAPGSPVISGGGQAGLFLAIRGAAANYTVQAGQFFSVITGGRRSLYQCQTATVLNASGVGTLPIRPMLRTTPNDGDTVEMLQPYLEGFAPLGAAKWSIEMLVRVGIKFTVTEDR